MNKKIEQLISTSTFPKVRGDCGDFDPMESDMFPFDVLTFDVASTNSYCKSCECLMFFVNLKASAN